MRRIAWTVLASVLAASSAQADWGATSSGSPVSEALGPGYGPPPGYQAPPPPPGPPMEGPYPTLSSYVGAPHERPPAKYGLHPSIKHWLNTMMFWKKKGCDDCAGCGNGGGHGHGANGGMYNTGGHGPHINTGPAPQQGTLVFPNHPFVRGPRDYYMWEPK